ncbi:MAG: DUF4268 domain-containing protein [Thermoanaerobaculia bacterium]
MSNLQHAGPVVIPTTGTPVVMKKLSLLGQIDGEFFDEKWLQATLFEHPSVLPIDEIDIAYEGCIPVCRELNTAAGPIDLLYVTPKGRLVIVETKLWRNPEARRTVVTQTLDYAKELATWDFDDLSREVGKVKGKAGSGILEIVRSAHPELIERDFVDQVSATLRTGRFLLLIVGDGIREGVHALTDFLDRYGSLEFTFGLVEIGVYEHPNVGRLIHPRVLAKTAIIKRSIVTVEKGLVLRETGPEQEVLDEVDEEWARRSAFYLEYWTQFLKTMEIDDTSQPKANPTKTENIYFYMPPSRSLAWVSAYFAQSKKQVGVYLRLTNSDAGKSLYDALWEQRQDIEKELGSPMTWTDRNGKYGISITMPYDDLAKPSTEDSIERFFKEWLNRFISTFRPKLERLSSELGLS